MADEQTTTVEALRGQLRVLTTQIREAEIEYGKAVEHAAETEAIYRLDLAQAIKAQRADGVAATTAETLARGDVVLQSKARDVAAGKVKLAGEVLENRRDDRRNLWRLVDAIRTPSAPVAANSAGWPAS